MLLVRIGVGIGEATGVAPAHSLLSDYYSAERRSTVLAILVMSGQLGTMVALVGGGWLNEQIGWRGVFYLFGGIGLVVAPLIYWTVREPPRGQLEKAPVHSQSLDDSESSVDTIVDLWLFKAMCAVADTPLIYMVVYLVGDRLPLHRED